MRPPAKSRSASPTRHFSARLKPMALAYQYLTQQDGATEIVGRGIRVYTILGWKQLGEMPEHIADEYGLPIAAVYEALAYATSHAEEMERIRQADEEAQAWALSQVPEKIRHGPPLP